MDFLLQEGPYKLLFACIGRPLSIPQITRYAKHGIAETTFILNVGISKLNSIFSCR